MDKSSVDKRYARARIRQVGAMLFVYAIFYVCRLAFSASKKGMIEQGAYTPAEIGYVGSAMLFAYAIGSISCSAFSFRRLRIFLSASTYPR